MTEITVFLPFSMTSSHKLSASVNISERSCRTTYEILSLV